MVGTSARYKSLQKWYIAPRFPIPSYTHLQKKVYTFRFLEYSEGSTDLGGAAIRLSPHQLWILKGSFF